MKAISVGVLILVCVASGACSRSASPVEPTAGPVSAVPDRLKSAPAPTQAARNFEVDFLTDMIDHHHMAVMMSETCVQKAVHADLRALCEDIIAAQSQEIEMMQTWLQAWYGVQHEPEMKPGSMKMMERLASASAAEFEIAFMEMMIRHHRKAVIEGERCLARAWHPELHALCQNIIETQTEEIALMSSWLCQWYDRCRGAAA
jgi:uncharacterized protein (DUF305 family)